DTVTVRLLNITPHVVDGTGRIYLRLGAVPKGPRLEPADVLAEARGSKAFDAFKPLADALLVLKLNSSVTRSPVYQRRFDEALQTYRAAAIKPSIPEDARRSIVQGTTLVKWNDFAG